jgi:nucleosome binding factor SPN SPT16 subunit
MTKDSATGPFAEEWKTALEGISKDTEQVDLGPILSNAALATKDEKELVRVTHSRLSSP